MPRALPGVVAVLTAADLPIVASGKGRLYEPLAREEVVLRRPAGRDGRRRDRGPGRGRRRHSSTCELEPLEPVVDLEGAARPGAPRARVIEATRGRGIRHRRRSRRGGGRRAGGRGALRQRPGHRPAGQRRRRRGAGRQRRRWSADASRRPGCTRATSRRRRRRRGWSPRASSWFAAPPRRRSRPATRWPSCSGCRPSVSACAALRWAAPSAAR